MRLKPTAWRLLAAELRASSEVRYLSSQLFCIMCRALRSKAAWSKSPSKNIYTSCKNLDASNFRGIWRDALCTDAPTPQNAASKPLYLLALIRLWQPIEIRYRICTIKIPVPCLLRQDPGIHARFPTPLHRILRHPSPVEPTPTELKARHLCFGICHKPLLVGVAVGAWIGIGAVTGAGARVGRA